MSVLDAILTKKRFPVQIVVRALAYTSTFPPQVCVTCQSIVRNHLALSATNRCALKSIQLYTQLMIFRVSSAPTS